MLFEVYCDEAMPDLFTSQKPGGRYLLIGSLWLPASLREEIKEKIRFLRDKHNTWGEIKWSKVSPSRLPFYLALVDLFESYEFDICVFDALRWIILRSTCCCTIMMKNSDSISFIISYYTTGFLILMNTGFFVMPKQVVILNAYRFFDAVSGMQTFHQL